MQTEQTKTAPTKPVVVTEPWFAKYLPKQGEPIPMRLLRFKSPTDIPGNEACTSVRTGGQVNQNRWEIVLVPHMRQYIVQFIPAGRAPVPPCYVHESQVSVAEPA